MKRMQQSVVFGATWVLIFAGLLVGSTLNSCATLNALAGLSRVQFKLNNVQSVRLAGIDITNKHSISDFNIMDGANLLGAFSSGRFPLTFTLNVAAMNPNPSSGANAVSAIQITDFPWRLLVNQHETVSGNIGSPISIPSGGQTSMLPLQVSVDLKQFFANQGYNDLLNLALQLAGQSGTSNLQLKATPSMGTPLGTMRYPGELTIVSTQFTS